MEFRMKENRGRKIMIGAWGVINALMLIFAAGSMDFAAISNEGYNAFLIALFLFIPVGQITLLVGFMNRGKKAKKNKLFSAALFLIISVIEGTIVLSGMIKIVAIMAMAFHFLLVKDEIM